MTYTLEIENIIILAKDREMNKGEYRNRVKTIIDILDKQEHGNSDLLDELISEIQRTYFQLGKQVQALGIDLEIEQAE